jgi:hypothetical protein
MEIVIDTIKLNKRKLSIMQFLVILTLYHHKKGTTIDFDVTDVDNSEILDLETKGYIEINGGSLSISKKGINFIEGRGRNYEELAMRIRDEFPKGKKNNKYPWKGILKGIVDKLKKLDRNYGLSIYTDNQIIQAVKEYVGQFNSMTMDTGMQICPYFVEKNGTSNLIAWLESSEVEKESNDYNFTEKL